MSNSSSDRVILEAGQKAPEFTLVDAFENPVSLADFSGKKVILFFYPAAMTPGCTKEACDFRDSLEPLQAAGYEVLGISPDKPAKLQKFIERDGLTYTLLSDPEKKTLESYGAFGDKSLYGRISRGVIRSTFVIDEDGKVEHALYNVKATGHVGRVRTLIGI